MLRTRVERLERGMGGAGWEPYDADAELAATRAKLAALVAALPRPPADVEPARDAMRSLQAALRAKAERVSYQWRWIRGRCYVRAAR
jgi:hypothetical protein